LFWEIVKGTTGPKAIVLHLFFGLIVSAPWLFCQHNTIAALNKEIVKILSARATIPLRRPQSYDPLLGTQMPARMNIGFFS
jgi:hypothetical protein